MNSPLALIIKREYMERVARKSFIITTLLMPIFMVALMALPSLVMIFAGPENKSIAVVDHSGAIGDKLSGGNELKFVAIEDANTTIDSLRKSDYDAILIIGKDVVDDPSDISLYSKGAPSIQTESYIRSQIEDIIKNQRIKKYDIDNLKEIIADLNVSVNIDTYRLDSEDEAQSTSSMVSYFIGIVVAMMLYMFLLLYGQMVMTSIIEEKNNRVLEIIVSSVKPQTLMLGKILGICAVAITQILIWGVLIGSFSKWVMPLITAGINSSDPELTAAMAQLGNAGFMVSLFLYILLFLIFGFLFYAAIFAAIGSAVDNIQDASQLTMLPTLPIILGIVFSMVALNDPNSQLSVWMSMIPFTSPMVMLSRIPFGIPSWQIWVSLLILVVSVFAMVWLAAKVYRVGIFMYGKKPSIKDLIRWARYK